ncbi:hypothetical protein [Streptomyces sp. S.PB5]|uniref:hypothetical protein n=1 Tax=Streptomyces sp. S.PB5 TaxID=3020844 RepID=UPI0025B0C7DF|nr:hypothetical protein [Streptomyces sp. S.PB5]MDN3027935.1 hypothetical protein [Streptomyces sp. S.PB5]
MSARDPLHEFQDVYRPSERPPVFAGVPELNFLMLDGTGDPNPSTVYRTAVEALCSAP